MAVSFLLHFEANIEKNIANVEQSSLRPLLHRFLKNEQRTVAPETILNYIK